MTAVRPEGAWQPGTDPDEWGVYEPSGRPAYQPYQQSYGQDPQQQPYVDPYAQQHWNAEPAHEPTWVEQTLQLRVVASPHAPAGGGRAERRRAAQGRVALRSGTGRRRATGRAAAAGSRVRPKESKRVIAARVTGELFITFGMVLLLFVAYQLWWTNVQADQAAGDTRSQLEQQWNTPAQPVPSGAPTPAPKAFEPGQGFAIIYLPKLGLKFPIAEGTDKKAVLDKGLVGHYVGTAMPGDASGNFALAAHRNTHGEPFRYINKMGPGDVVVIETAASYYTYTLTSVIPETPPTNVGVIQPVPKGSGFSKPGPYITLTTCTPEFTSKFRLIEFGKLTDTRPRSQGQPSAISGM